MFHRSLIEFKSTRCKSPGDIPSQGTNLKLGNTQNKLKIKNAKIKIKYKEKCVKCVPSKQ